MKRFIACSDATAESQDGRSRMRVLETQSPDGLCDAFDSLASNGQMPLILLHYVGYGYERNGAPRWLVDGLEALIGARRGLRLATVFHELYATSPPWRRAFWYSRSQKDLARRLFALSSASLCTTEVNREILRSWSATSDVECLAVPSTLGEPPVASWPPFEQRRNALVVFGLPATRERTYAAVADWHALVQRLGIEELIDVGPGICRAYDVPVRVTRLGPIASSEASRLMLEVKYGLLAYPIPILAKSSIFAAYVSHGVASLIAGAGVSVAEGAQGLRYFMHVPDAIAADDGSLAALSAAAHAWYASHSGVRHAEWVSQRLRMWLQRP